MTSIRDIARRARVSIGTVDRVLHERGRVSERTRARIREIVAALDYKPNVYARNLSLAKTYTFGVLMPKLSQDSRYWQLPARGIARAAEQLAPYRVRIRAARFDRYSSNSFERAARKLADEGIDGLLVAPVLPGVAGRVISGVFRRIPYVFFDSTIPDNRVLACVAQDPYRSGVLAGNLMTMILGRGGSVVIVKVLPDDFHITERIRGFEAALRKDALHEVRTEAVDSRNFTGVLNRLLQGNGGVRGIFVSNAWTHAIARKFRSHRDGERKVRIIGYDLVAGNVRELKAGSIDFLISQRPAMQGYLGVMALYRHVVLRESVRKRIMVPLDILTRDNLSYYHDEDEVIP